MPTWAVAASPISPPECALLDELRLLVVVDNETDTLSSINEGVPQVSEIAHLTARVPTSRASRFRGRGFLA